MPNSQTITVEQLADEIMRQLEEYTSAVIEDINLAGERIAREGAQELRQGSPERTGKYAKGWAYQKDKQHRALTRYTIYNKAKPQLTHLLEYGHALRGGGRVVGKPHMAPVEENAVKRYTEAVEEAIQRAR